MMDPSALPPPSIHLAPEALEPAYDQAKVAGEVMSDYQAWKSYRQPHEGTWFVNAAMLRGPISEVAKQIKTLPEPTDAREHIGWEQLQQRPERFETLG